MKTIREHNKPIKKVREAAKEASKRRAGVVCDECGKEMIIVRRAQAISINSDEVVQCEDCEIQIVKLNPKRNVFDDFPPNS